VTTTEKVRPGTSPGVADKRSLHVRKITARTGAEILGLDLASGLDDDQVHAVREALLRHRVVFFRGQHLSSDEQIALASRFGTLTSAHPTIPAVAELPPVLELDSLRGGQADQWHTDVTFVDKPPTYSFLRAIDLPEVGGDTLWANTVAGYEDLRPELRQFAEQLRAVHTNQFDYARVDLSAVGNEVDSARLAYLRQFVSTKYESEHPVVRIHPETNERALLLGSFVQRLVGYPTGASLDIVRLLQSAVTKPENTVRWRWSVGDLAIWDNRSTQHYATFDYGKAHRQMQRVTTVGTVPVGVDGRPSTAIVGDSTAYNARVVDAA
jgi:alpha-ketoglutarate-dependent sulfate ester dioxygenase